MSDISILMHCSNNFSLTFLLCDVTNSSFWFIFQQFTPHVHMVRALNNKLKSCECKKLKLILLTQIGNFHLTFKCKPQQQSAPPYSLSLPRPPYKQMQNLMHL